METQWVLASIVFTVLGFGGFGLLAEDAPRPAIIAAGDAPMPDEPRLRGRISDFYRAYEARDARALYEMHVPFLQSVFSLEEFKEESGFDDAWSAERAAGLVVDLEEPCYCRNWTYPDGSAGERCVLVLRGVEEGPSGQQQAGKFLDMWDYVAGEWYHWGPGEGAGCPTRDAVRPGVPTALAEASVQAGAVPEESRLRTRIEEHASAVNSRSARALYEMQAPYIRSHMSLEDYKRTWQMDEEWAKQPQTRWTVELEKACSCIDWMYPDGSDTYRCVLLLNGRDKGTAGRGKSKWLVMWEYAGGEWYYGMPGEGDRCPENGGAGPVTELSAGDLPVGTGENAARQAVLLLAKSLEAEGYKIRGKPYVSELKPGKAGLFHNTNFFHFWKGRHVFICVAVPPDTGVRILAQLAQSPEAHKLQMESVGSGWGLILRFRTSSALLQDPYMLMVVQQEPGPGKSVPYAVLSGEK